MDPGRRRRSGASSIGLERFIDVAATIVADPQSARRTLRDAPAEVFGAVEHDERGLAPHSFRTRMTVVVGTGATIEHEVFLDVGRVPGDEQPLVVDLRVRAADHSSVLPTFDGVLALTREDDGSTTLRLRGDYTAPLGAVGAMGDTLVGHRIVRSSMERLVERLGRRLDTLDRRGGERVPGTTGRGRIAGSGTN